MDMKRVGTLGQPLSCGYHKQVHCTTPTTQVCLVNIREHLNVLVSKMTQTPDEYSTTSPAQGKLKALKILRPLRKLVEGALQKEIDLY